VQEELQAYKNQMLGYSGSGDLTGALHVLESSDVHSVISSCIKIQNGMSFQNHNSHSGTILLRLSWNTSS